MGSDSSAAAMSSAVGLDGKNLIVNPDGTFEIAVSREPRRGRRNGTGHSWTLCGP
jgi:hypothetical protein